MSTPLSLVALNGQPESVAARVRRLQAEARGLARDHIGALAASLAEVQTMAAEIAEGGDAYPAGIRDLARRLADDAEARLQTLSSLNGRA